MELTHSCIYFMLNIIGITTFAGPLLCKLDLLTLLGFVSFPWVSVLSRKLVFSIPGKLGESKIQHCSQKEGISYFQQGQKTHKCCAFSSLQTRFIVVKSGGIYTSCHLVASLRK